MKFFTELLIGMRGSYLNREITMSLLKEVESAFESFNAVPSISVTESRIHGRWEWHC